MVDLFGDTIDESAPRFSATIRRELGPYNYRPRVKKEECCKTCAHCIVKEWSKRYYKCEFVGCSNCEATDIRAYHVCDAWEKEELHKELIGG